MDALRLAGLESDVAPASLPVRHHEVSVDLAPETLFGPESTRRFSGDLPLEVRLVSYGLKPMALIHAPAGEAGELLRRCEESSLHAIVGPFAFDADGDRAAGGYVNVAANQRPATPDLNGWRGLLVARDVRQLKLGWLSLLFQWDEFLGQLLGYPDCCVRAFRKNWEAACSDFNGEVGAVLLAQDRGPIHAAHCCMNIFARYFGFHLTEHFPCSFGCEATARLGERLLNGLRRYEPAFAAELARMLSAPVLYAGKEGTYLFPDAAWRDGALRFSRVLSSVSDSTVLRRLADCEVLPHTADCGTLMRFPAAA